MITSKRIKGAKKRICLRLRKQGKEHSDESIKNDSEQLNNVCDLKLNPCNITTSCVLTVMLFRLTVYFLF